MERLFITSSGTHIGKTLIATTLCWQARQMRKRVLAIKPLVSGYSADDSDSDVTLLLQSQNLPLTHEYIEKISPWRLKAPLSPNLAAKREGRELSLSEIVDYCEQQEGGGHDLLIVEGIGGAMVPINETHTTLDWIEALHWPVVVVGGNYLGSISHTLTTIEVLRGRSLNIRAVIISDGERSELSLDETAATIAAFVPKQIPVLKIPQLRAQPELWKQMPPIDCIGPSAGSF